MAPHLRSRKIEFGKQLNKLCKNGQLTAGLALYRKMRANNIECSHWNLSALLNGCLKSQSNQRSEYLRIWQEVVIDDGVRPNFVCYSTAMRCAHICSDYDFQIFIGCKMKEKYADFMVNYHWNRMIESLLKSKRTRSALNTFKEMKMRKIAPSMHTMSIMLDGFIKNERFAEFEEFVVNELDFDSLNDFGFTNLMHGLSKCGHSDFINIRFWNKMIENGINPNINTLAVGICAAKKSKNEHLLNLLVQSIKKSESLHKISPFIWNQIISAFGSLGKCDKMWSEFREYRRLNAVNAPCMNILTTLCSMEKRIDFKRKALIEEALPFFDEMSGSQLKFFYRAALSLNEMNISNVIKQKMQKKKDRVNSVVASFEFDGMQFCVNNNDVFYDEMLDEVMQCIDYKVSIDHHPELNDAFGARKFIKYHSEKKALAFLLNKKVKDIEIRINLRMCRDCHSFFEAVSKHYDYANIHCIDPRTKHIFKNGLCTSCGQ